MAETKGSVTDQMDILPVSSNADRTFHCFPDLPAEIHRMIWREFYLEPRTFHFQLHGCDKYRDGFDNGDDDFMLEYTYKISSALPGLQSYYHSIDTSIDRTSADVARTVRPRFWLNSWLYRDDSWIGVMPFRDPASHARRPMRPLPKDVRVNWDADWTSVTDQYGVFHMGGFEPEILLTPQTDWWANIRNLVLDYQPIFNRLESRFVTEMNVDLWVCHRKMPQLEQVRAVLKPWALESVTDHMWRVYELCEALARFQRRYLLRQKSCADARTWGIKVDFVLPPQVAELTWDRVQSLVSRAGFMTEFEADMRHLRELRELRQYWCLDQVLCYVENLASEFKVVDLEKDEEKGAIKLFSRLDLEPIQAVMKGLDKWVEHDVQQNY